jgi:hypothetical protein
MAKKYVYQIESPDAVLVIEVQRLFSERILWCLPYKFGLFILVYELC